MEPELKQQIADAFRSRLAEGFDTPDEVLDRVCEFFDEADADTVRAIATAELPVALRQRQAEQQSWPATTDCDRLDAAFDELNSMGIMARHHWTCCGTCGSAAMPDEFERLDGHWRGTPIIGYTFYHIQNTESAVEGDGICLGYGSTIADDAEAMYEARSVEIGHTVVRVLTAHGLKTDWNGSLDRKICINLDWKRRARPARFFEGDDSEE